MSLDIDEEIQKLQINDISVLDLFCGCGGMSKGLMDAGLNVIAGLDIWDKCISTYEKNLKHLSICADIQKLSPKQFAEQYNIDNIDVIVGGPPCQGFSMAGKRNESDPRNVLFRDFFKYIRYYVPKMFIMENVVGIMSMKQNDSKVTDIITDLVQDLYEIKFQKLCASDFEVPQNRNRIFIIGIAKTIKKQIHDITPPIKDKSLRISVSTILEDEIDDNLKSYYLSEKAIEGINKKREKSKQSNKGFGAQFLNFDKPSYTIPSRYYKDGYDALVKYNETKIRRLTILELKRIQSFPDDFEIIGTKKEQIIQIGNAVPCRLAYYIGKHIIHTLS